MKALMRILLIRVVCFLSVFLLAQEICANETCFSVRSLYLDSISNKWEKEITWIFNVKDSTCITVTKENRTEPDLTIRYLPDGLLEEVEDHVSGIHRNRQAKGDKIVLSWGFPVPYDYLAPFDDSISEAVIKKEVGGAIFSCKVTREIQNIGIDEAFSENMIAPNIAKTICLERLRLITIKRNGNLVVRQLWPGDGSWWVYEETPHRKSWLVEK